MNFNVIYAKHGYNLLGRVHRNVSLCYYITWHFFLKLFTDKETGPNYMDAAALSV